MAKEKESSFIVYGTNGLIDYDSSVEAFRQSLAQTMQDQAERIEKINTAVHAVFDNYPKENIQQDPFLTLVVSKMGVGAFEQVEMKKHIMNYVRNNAEFKVYRGPGGGVRRVSDELLYPPKK